MVTGRPASPGLVAGRLHAAVTEQESSRPVGDPAAERQALEAAIAAASAEIADLMERVGDEDAAAMLEFQLALLEDDEFAAPALERIRGGAAAETAIRAVVGEMAAEFEAAPDEYLAARAADIGDLGDRVLRQFGAAPNPLAALADDAILVADDLGPGRFLEHAWRKGQAIVLRRGSPTAHVAMLARSRGVPMVVGAGEFPVADGMAALLDGDAGTLTVSPSEADLAAFSARTAIMAKQAAADGERLLRPALTADGEPVAVHLNIADPSELDGLDPAICDGIGLVRTEFLFRGATLPSEDEQLAVYRRILDWARGRPVTIRTLDAGGDKPVAGLTVAEPNPFLGLRGVRLSLARPEVFRRQLRALLRAAPFGDLRIMLPMIALPQELDTVRAMLAGQREALGKAGVGTADFALGIMVEVPAAALTLEQFDVDFASIGSNDLAQYVMAAARDSDAVGGLADTAAPAVLALIGMAVRTAREKRLPISLCGDAGGDPRVLPLLLDAGLRSVSVSPSRVGATKRVISGWRAGSRTD